METTTLENLSTSVKEVNNNASGNETIVRKEMENSPFTIITIENESFGVMGQYRLTETFKSRKEVEEELNKMTWNRLVQVFMILNELKEKAELTEKKK